MTLLYGIIFALSLLMPVFSFRSRNRDDRLNMLTILVAICNGGYFGLALSRSLKAALFFNSAAYLGNVFLPFLILMMVVRLSGLRFPPVLRRVLIMINTAVFLITASGGYSSLYYKEVSLEVVNGAARLVKVYGPLHGFYKVYVIGYFMAIAAVICYAAVKKTSVSARHTGFLAIMLLGNIALWLAENITGAGFEFLTISYLMTESLILLLHGILQEYEDPSPAASPGDLAYTDEDASSTAEMQHEAFRADEIRAVFGAWEDISSLSQREQEVLRFILEKRKRKDIAQVMFVTESTIKKHTGGIYKKLDVANRTELFEKARSYISK